MRGNTPYYLWCATFALWCATNAALQETLLPLTVVQGLIGFAFGVAAVVIDWLVTARKVAEVVEWHEARRRERGAGSLSIDEGGTLSLVSKPVLAPNRWHKS